MGLAETILTLLYDRRDGAFGLAELVDATGAGGPAVSAALEELAARGHVIERDPARGVRLGRPVRPAPVLIERDLGTRRLGRSVLCFDEVDSTNDVAAAAVAQPDTDGLVVLTEHQRRGRGRLGRTWTSPPGANVLMSVVLQNADRALCHEALTIAAGLSVAEGVDRVGGVSCRLKWPNDVLLLGRKVAGVLVELRRGPAGEALVVGMGVNVTACPSADMAPGAGCLADVAGDRADRTELVRAILQCLDGWVVRIAEGDTGALAEAFAARCDMINRRATIVTDGVAHVGRVLAVSCLEGLVLCDDHGNRLHLPARTSSVAACEMP